MKRLLTFLFILIALAVSGSSTAQISTQGNDFWVNFMPNYTAGYTTTIYISAKDACSGTLSNPSTGYSASFTVGANAVTSITIPINHVVSGVAETVLNAAVHIISSDTISVFGLNYVAFSTDATFFIPTQSLGINYRVASYVPLGGMPSQIGIWAVEDSTDIEIITSQNSSGAYVAGVADTIRLNKGQSYLITSTADLTGSSVRSLKPCTPIAVLGGAGCANVPAGCTFCNHIFEQMLPIETWGKSFFMTPTRTKPSDYYRVIASVNGTTVQIGATTINLNAGQFTEQSISSQPVQITSNQPIAVVGYTTGSSCSANFGDPSMYWVSPTEQTLTELVFNTISFSGLDSQYVNIVVKTGDTSRVRLNGNAISGNFQVNASVPGYAYAQIRLNTVTNIITCDSGFLANVYGYGPYNAYAYSAGASLKGVQTSFVIGGRTYTTDDTLRLCYGNSYPFGALSPYNNITKIFWEFGDGDTITHLTPSHSYTDTGFYQLNAYISTSSACSFNEDTMVAYIQVKFPEVRPMADTTLCLGDSVRLRATGLWAENTNRRFYYWYQGSTYIGQGQPKVAPAANTQYTVIYTDSCAIINDTGYVTINVNPSTNVILNHDTTLCHGQSLQLHAALSAPASGITYTWTNGIGGTGFSDSLVTPTANTLYAIRISGNCVADSTDSVQVTLRPVLDVSLRPDTTICTGQSVNLNAAGTGGDSTYIFTWDNGLGTGVSKTVSPITTTTYRVIISDGCTVTPDTAYTTIYVRPALDVTLTADTTLCQSQSVNLMATGTGGDSSYTFTWNNSLGTGTSKLVSPAGTTQYRVIISDACTVKPDTAYVNITVRAALDIALRSDTTICRGQSVNLAPLATGGRSPYILTWDNGLGTGTSKTVSPTATTTYRVILGDGCSPNDTAYTTVNVRPALDVILRSDTTICIGQSVNLDASGTGGDSTYTFTWDNGLGTGISKTVSPAITTTYRVIISDGCTVRPDTAYTTIRVRPALDVTLRSDTTICKGRFVQLIATGRGGDSTYTFTWDQGLGTGISKFVNPDTTTTYQVIINDACTFKADTAYTRIYVRPPLDITLRPDTMICNGQTVNITAQGYGGDSSYTFTWNHGLGTGVTNIVAPSITTIYEVIIRDGCTVKPDTAITIVNVRMGLQLAMGQTDTTICQGGSVTLWGTPGGGDSSYTYNWLPVNASTSTLNVSPDTTTQYAMILGDACTMEPDTQWMTIFVRPNPELGISNDTTICLGGIADMSAWGTGGDSSYIFTWTGIGTGASTQVTPVSTRSYQVILSDQCSIMGDTAYTTVFVRPALDAAIRPDTTICTGQSVDLWVIARGGDSSYTYTWDQGLGNTSNENVIPTATTTYRMILGDACTQKNDTAYTTVYVRPPLGIRVSRDTSICEGESVVISAVGSGGDSSYNYTWNQGVGNGASHLITPAATTIYRVDLDDNCSPPVQGQVTVSVEQKPVMSFAPTPSGVCLGDSIFFDNQTAGSTNYAYIWRFGDTKTSGAHSPTYAYKNAGTFNVVLVAVSSLCRDSVSRPVNVYPNPVARFTPSPAVTDLRTPEITFNNQSVLGNSYDWDFGDMLGGSSAENPQYSYPDTGWYVATLTVRSINNCIDTAMRTIRINDYYTFFAPNAFSPNDNKKNDLYEVKGHGWEAYRISIYNRWGEKVFESEDPASPWNGEVQKRGVMAPEGLYYYHIEILDVFKKRHFYEGSITLLK